MDRFKLIWGFREHTEGVEYFVTAEAAQERAYQIGTALGIEWAYGALMGIKARGEYRAVGYWIKLEQHQSPSPCTNPSTPTQEVVQQR